ncbi:MAG: hypothetical protein WC430_03785 [Patescibacteria group bacterium]
MLKNLWQKLKDKLRQKEINSYAKGLIFSMRTAVFNAKSKNPQMDFDGLVRLAIPLRSKDWRFLKSQNDSDCFVYKDSEKVKIEKNHDFADVLCAIADTEIQNMYFGTINKNYMSVKDSGQFMLQGLGESEMIEKIIREELTKYSNDDLKNWR